MFMFSGGRDEEGESNPLAGILMLILGPLAQIPVGEGRVFDIGGLRIAVFHTRSGAVYATQASCPPPPSRC